MNEGSFRGINSLKFIVDLDLVTGQIMYKGFIVDLDLITCQIVYKGIGV